MKESQTQGTCSNTL